MRYQPGLQPFNNCCFIFFFMEKAISQEAVSNCHIGDKFRNPPNLSFFEISLIFALEQDIGLDLGVIDPVEEQNKDIYQMTEKNLDIHIVSYQGIFQRKGCCDLRVA